MLSMFSFIYTWMIAWSYLSKHVLPNYSLTENILWEDANCFIWSFISLLWWLTEEFNVHLRKCLWRVSCYTQFEKNSFYIIRSFVFYFKMIHMGLTLSMPQTLEFSKLHHLAQSAVFRVLTCAIPNYTEGNRVSNHFFFWSIRHQVSRFTMFSLPNNEIMKQIIQWATTPV